METYGELIKKRESLKKELKLLSTRIQNMRASTFMKTNKIRCDICRIETDKYNFENHLKTKKHIKNMAIKW